VRHPATPTAQAKAYATTRDLVGITIVVYGGRTWGAAVLRPYA
jgi:hypothetical protein